VTRGRVRLSGRRRSAGHLPVRRQLPIPFPSPPLRTHSLTERGGVLVGQDGLERRLVVFGVEVAHREDGERLARADLDVDRSEDGVVGTGGIHRDGVRISGDVGVRALVRELEVARQGRPSTTRTSTAGASGTAWYARTRPVSSSRRPESVREHVYGEFGFLSLGRVSPTAATV